MANDSSCEAGMHHFQADLSLTSHSRVLLIQIYIWQDTLWACIKWIRTPLVPSESITKWRGEGIRRGKGVSFVEWFELCFSQWGMCVSVGDAMFSLHTLSFYMHTDEEKTHKQNKHALSLFPCCKQAGSIHWVDSQLLFLLIIPRYQSEWWDL